MKKGIPVVLCVGSDKISGDAVGPLVGDLLKNTFNVRCFVYGATGAPVNGKNLDSYVSLIERAHAGSPVIAVDACLGTSDRVGDTVVTGGVNPKRALTRVKNRVGDVGILGVIGETSNAPLSELMTVPWVDVEKISFKIAFSLFKALSATL